MTEHISYSPSIWRSVVGRDFGAGPKTYIAIGDSRVASGAQDGTPPASYNVSDSLRSPFTHLQTMLGGRLVQLRNAGVSGETISQILSRLQADVIAYRPGWCFLLAPVNDIVFGTPLEAIQANVVTMHRMCWAANIGFATSTVSAWTSINTFARRALHAAYNRWIKQYCLEWGIPLADEIAATSGAGTGLPLAQTTYDTNHYNDYGASLAARAWYAALNPIIPPQQSMSGLPYDHDNLIWDGNAGWAVGGSLPTGWSASSANVTGLATSTAARTQDFVQGSVMVATATASAQGAIVGVAASASYSFTTGWAATTSYSLGQRRVGNDGNQYVCTTAGTSGSAQPPWNAAIGATTLDGTVTWTRYENFAVGDRCYAEAEYFVDTVSGGNLGFSPQLVMQGQGVSQNIVVRAVTDQGTRCAPDFLGSGLMRSRNFVIAPGCTGYIPTVRAFMDNSVTGTLRVGRIALKHAIDI